MIRFAGISFAFRTSGLREEIALKIHIAHLAGGNELFPGLDLLRQHHAARRLVSLCQCRLFRGGRPFKVDFQDVSQRNQRFTRIARHIVVERNGIAGRSQPLAGSDYQIVRAYAFQNLDHRVSGRQQRDAVFEQEFARAIDERLLPITEDVESHQQRAVERTARGCIGILGAEEVLDPVPKQQFVADDLLVAIQDGLPRYESEPFNGAGRSCFFCG